MSEPIAATPISSAPPPFVPVQLDPSKDSGKNIEGTSANPEEAAGAEQMEKKVEEVAAKKSKARSRDSEAKGKWWPCTTTETELRNLEAEGFPKPGSWRMVSGSLTPAHEAGEWVVTKALIERGFSLPPSDFFTEILKAYQLQPHNISPNSILAISNHVTLCEGHLRVTPELSLFQYYFSVKKEKVSQTSSLATCGSITFKLRPGRIYPRTDRHESVRYWSGGFFYLKDVSDPASSKVLPEFKDGPASETSAWTQCPHLSESTQLTRATGRDDLMRASKDNLSADALDKRIRALIKIPRDLRIHVCNIDIHTNGSGIAALEEKDLGTLTRVPHAGNTDPEAASDAEAPEAPAPTKRKRGASSGPASKRARKAPTVAATRKAEAEKKCLKQIDTSKQSQPNIDQFFLSSSKSSGSKPHKNPKKKAKPSPATMPITQEVEVPPKASSSATANPKDVINLDDLPEEPNVEFGKGGYGKGESSKGASSSHPPPEEPDVTSAEATASDVMTHKYRGSVTRCSGGDGGVDDGDDGDDDGDDVPLDDDGDGVDFPLREGISPADSCPPESSFLSGVLRPAEAAVTLHASTPFEGHIKVLKATLEGHIKVFFAQHKSMRQNTRKLHEDLCVIVLEQKTEIEGMHKSYADSQKAITILETRVKNHEEEIANRPSIKEISAELEVLKAEHESLQKFLKESSEKETKEKQELEEKHAQAMSELADRLKKSNQRVKTLALKTKAYETEAENIDKMIFPSLGFEWTKESSLSSMEAYKEARNSIDDLFKACRGIAKSLSLKRAGTTLIDRMTKLMRMVPDLIKDWQESSSRGVASITLAMCKAHFPTLSFASVARGVPKGTNIKASLAETQGYDRLFAGRVNHSFWYNKYDLLEGFSDTEDVEEGSGSSANHSNQGSGDDSGDGSAYEASEDEEHTSE
ncbi:hypothetical protein QYE76_066439 [Lolium multiflorum]|uniref:Transposase (putative) gypsy type domain-containing protein n=1 Tax=Lolium multiflorum TaxID=4521 RepID=A0AAD8WC11_LOLMU|nr:hypothetical protein QYE76_066439 [Lolium multiflorum]